MRGAGVTVAAADNLLNQAIGLHKAGDVRGAIRAYEKFLKKASQHPGALNLLGLAYFQDGKPARAVPYLQRALALQPDLPGASFNLGIVLQKMERYEEAIACFEKAIAAEPRDADAHNAMASALKSLGRKSEAKTHFEQAVALGPDQPYAHFNLAKLLYELHDYKGAREHYAKAMALGLPPADAKMATLFLAYTLAILGSHDEAERMFDRVIADPKDDEQSHNAKLSKGVMYLALGQFAQGWPLNESRYFSQTPDPLEGLAPPWNGEAITGPLLVRAEQGLGDEIIYASMISDLQKRVPSIVLEAEPRLVEMFARSFPGARIVARGSDLSQEQVTAQIRCGSLGIFLRPDWDSFKTPERGYLVADAGRAAELRRRLSTDRRKVVGLSWRSVSPNMGPTKTARLIDFLPVLRLPGIRFVDLQYGDTAEERAELEREAGIAVAHLDNIDNTKDIEGLAALMQACDAVLSVSNTNAHLAGALGRPTWVLVPFGYAKIWYWFKGQKKSPWYPHVQVRHRAEGQSWQDLLSQISVEFAESISAIRSEAG